MHQAGGVRSGDVFGAGGRVAGHLCAPHGYRDGILLDGEHAAESAALVAALGLRDLNALDHGEQVAEFRVVGDMEFARRREPHHAHAVAGVVQADAVREAGVEPCGFHHVVEKFADLPDAGVETGMLAVVVEQARVAFADEDHAAGRGPHDVVIPFEQCIHAFGERLGVALESRIGHRLSAAGLVERVVHVAAHAAEQFAGSASHFGVDGVDVTGDEQSDFHTLRFVFASRILGDTSKIAVFRESVRLRRIPQPGCAYAKGDRTLRYGPLAGCAVASCGASSLI